LQEIFCSFFVIGYIHLVMPNQRASGQTQISLFMKGDFIEFVDGCLPEIGYSDRSSFIRAAIKEKLTKDGFKVPNGLDSAPYRAGKIIRYTDAPPTRNHLNEAPNSTKASAETRLLKKGVAGMPNASLARKPSPSTDAPSAKASVPKSGNAPHPKSRPEPQAQTPTEPADGKE
jgi:hypothetical protein